MKWDQMETVLRHALAHIECLEEHLNNLSWKYEGDSITEGFDLPHEWEQALNYQTKYCGGGWKRRCLHPEMYPGSEKEQKV